MHIYDLKDLDHEAAIDDLSEVWKHCKLSPVHNHMHLTNFAIAIVKYTLELRDTV